MIVCSFSFLSFSSWASGLPTSQEWLARCGAPTSLPLLPLLRPSLPNFLLQTPLYFTSCRGLPEKATPQKSNKIYAPEKRSKKTVFSGYKTGF
jgi:hypothetical protein